MAAGAGAGVEDDRALGGPEIGVVVDRDEADIEVRVDAIIGGEGGGETLVEARRPLEVERGGHERAGVGARDGGAVGRGSDEGFLVDVGLADVEHDT